MKTVFRFLALLGVFALLTRAWVWVGILPEEDWYRVLTLTVACAGMLGAMRLEDRLDKAGGAQ